MDHCSDVWCIGEITVVTVARGRDGQDESSEIERELMSFVTTV